MKRVYVYAYLAGNLGDDLFVRLLCQRYPKTRFYILADPIYKERYRDLSNCRVCSPGDRRVRFLEKWLGRGGIQRFLVRHAAAVIHIGGSVFVQHQDDWSDLFHTDAYLAEHSRRLYVIGANFGPYVNPDYYKQYRKLFEKYRGICFRDRYSWELFRELPQVSWAPDVIFQLKPLAAEKKKKVLIAPIELEERKGKYDISGYEKAYLDFHIRMIRGLLARGYSIAMASFCQFQKDDAMMQKIMDGLAAGERRAVVCMAYQKDMAPILQCFAESEAVLGTRFHSIVLGWLHRCRVLPVIYDQKTEKTLEDLGPGLSLKLEELESEDADKLLDVWLGMEPMDIESLQKEAERQFQYTDGFLK